jgi:tRNA uridine 5-carboxymethylaminomethyl modification enzyme
LKKKSAKYRGQMYTLHHLLKMPEMDFERLEKLAGSALIKRKNLTDVSYIEATVKYEGYIKIQQVYIEKLKNLEKVSIPENIDYFKIDGLSTEVRQKLSRINPANLKIAQQIPGITPASINAIRIYLTLRAKA